MAFKAAVMVVCVFGKGKVGGRGTIMWYFCLMVHVPRDSNKKQKQKAHALHDDEVGKRS